MKRKIRNSIIIVIILLSLLFTGMLVQKQDTLFIQKDAIEKQALAETTKFAVGDCPYPIYFKKIYSGSRCNIGVDENGTLWGWGNSCWNGYDIFGTGATTAYKVPTVIHNGKSFKKISIGFYHALFLDNDGYLWASGLNSDGLFGDGTKKSTSTLIQIANSTKFKDVVCDMDATYAIDINGNIWGACGKTGKLVRDGGLTATLTQLTSGTVFEQLALGAAVYALDNEGNVWAWGNNEQGELGNGKTTGATNVTNIAKVNLNKKIVKVDATDTTAKAIDENGNLYMWGSTYNESGVSIQENTPVQRMVGTKFKYDYEDSSYNYTLDQNGNLYTRKWELEKTGVEKYIDTGYNSALFIIYKNGDTWVKYGDSYSSGIGTNARPEDWTMLAGTTYTINLNTNGGTIKSGNVTKYGAGMEVTLPTNVTKEGYTFEGWYNNSSCTGSRITSIGTTETGNKTYWAKWNSNKHTVTFKDGATVAKTQEVNHGEAATAPNLTKPGYVLRWDKEFSNITSDLTVNANWLKDTDGDGTPDIEDNDTKVKYTVLHYKQNLAQNGYEEPEREEKQGQLGSTAHATSKTYTGFTLTTTGETVANGTVTDDGNLILKLYYNRNKYTVTLNPNGGTINEQSYIREYIYGTGGNLPSNVTKEGYTFGGWYDNAELTGSAISQVTANDLNNKTYYANWIANGNTEYKVLHYKQGENGYQLAQTENLTAVTGATATAVPKIYEGYVENTSHEERVASGTVAADGSLELKLYYDILTYRVTFKDGKNVLDTQTIAYGRTATAPSITKEGYVLRWDKEYSNVKSDLTVNAIWLRDTDGDGIPDIEDPETLVEYIVKHYKQQGDTNTYELAEEEKLQGQLGSIVNATPKTYVGYAENTTAAERRPSGTITSDEKLELILLYYRLKYTVTFKDGDEIVSVIEVPHGETVIPPELTKPGYTLSWDKTLENITGEQTITAVWTKIPEEQREYKVEHYVETKDGGYILKETERQIGNIGDIVTGKEKVYEEYILDDTNESTVKTGKIEENQELVLKLYYKYKRFTVIFKDGEKEVAKQEVIYGGTAKPPILTKPGYILSWDKSLDKITGEQTIVAVWTKDPNYKDPNEGKEERPSILPQTGEETVTLGAMMVLLGISVISFIKYKF